MTGGRLVGCCCRCVTHGCGGRMRPPRRAALNVAAALLVAAAAGPTCCGDRTHQQQLRRQWQARYSRSQQRRWRPTLALEWPARAAPRWQSRGTQARALLLLRRAPCRHRTPVTDLAGTLSGLEEEEKVLQHQRIARRGCTKRAGTRPTAETAATAVTAAAAVACSAVGAASSCSRRARPRGTAAASSGTGSSCSHPRADTQRTRPYGQSTGSSSRGSWRRLRPGMSTATSTLPPRSGAAATATAPVTRSRQRTRREAAASCCASPRSSCPTLGPAWDEPHRRSGSRPRHVTASSGATSAKSRRPCPSRPTST